MPLGIHGHVPACAHPVGATIWMIMTISINAENRVCAVGQVMITIRELAKASGYSRTTILWFQITLRDPEATREREGICAHASLSSEPVCPFARKQSAAAMLLRSWSLELAMFAKNGIPVVVIGREPNLRWILSVSVDNGVGQGTLQKWAPKDRLHSRAKQGGR